MNILIDSVDQSFAKKIADEISSVLNIPVIVYTHGTKCTATGKYIVIGAPITTTGYRYFCASGYLPELVICIDSRQCQCHIERLEMLYEEMLVLVDGNNSNICKIIIQLIHNELINKKCKN